MFILVLLVIPAKMMLAQTDVTSLYLTNADFNTPPFAYTVAGGTVLNTAVTRIGTTGWIFPVPGWTNASIINANAVQIATGEMGTVANAQGFNNTAVPAANRLGETTGAAMSMSAGWGDRASYYQEVTLPAGRYVLRVDAFNGNTPTQAVANFFGFIPNEGTPIYGTRLNYPTNTWVTDSISFFLAAQTTGRINLGITTASGGSATGPRLFLDNVRLISYGIDKSVLRQLVDSAIVIKNNPQDVGTMPVYTMLQTAINAAQVVINNTAATAAQVLEMENNVKTAIADVHGAIILQQRILTWTTFPYNATSAIINPSFEQAINVGWTSQGPFARQTNDSFNPFRAGAAYAERWIANGQTLLDLRLSQVIRNIPNGTYLLTASAHAMQQADNTFPGGAFLFSNDVAVEIFERKDYSITVQVTDNIMEIAFEIGQTGNWVAIDNFRLMYISDGSPYLVATPSPLAFTPSATQRTFNLSGGNLAENVTITTSPSFAVSKATFTPAELMALGGIDVTVTALATKAIPRDSIVISHGNVRTVIPVSLTETLSASNAAFLFDQSMVPINNFTVTGDLYGAVTLTAPLGIVLSENIISAADALIGKEIVIMWDYETLVEDKYIHITSGSVRDSILVFATKSNLISYWDGNDAEGEGSRLTDFGWQLTMADGITPVAATFNPFNVSPGIRFVPVGAQNYVYRGKPWKGHRVAYLRSWGSPATNVFSLPVELTEGTTYMFRGISAWHDNENNPTFSYSVNTQRANLGDTLGIRSVLHTVRRVGHDFNFIFRAKTTGTHYVNVSSSVVNDVMSAPFFLSIHAMTTTATPTNNEQSLRVYPTLTRGDVNIDTGGAQGKVRVFDLAGKLITTKSLQGGVETLMLPTEGVFFLQINAGGQLQTVKVIRVR